jgi:hypothetical protein
VLGSSAVGRALAVSRGGPRAPGQKRRTLCSAGAPSQCCAALVARRLAGGGGRRAPPKLLRGVARSTSPRSWLPWPSGWRSRRRGLHGGRCNRILAEGTGSRAGATATVWIWTRNGCEPARSGMRLGIFFFIFGCEWWWETAMGKAGVCAWCGSYTS